MTESKNDQGRGGTTGLGDMVRDVAFTALGALFMTEDAVRNQLKDLKLPKEVMSGLLDAILKKKGDFYSLLAREFGSVLQRVDLGKEVSKFLQMHHIHMEAKISFEPKQEVSSGGEKSDT